MRDDNEDFDINAKLIASGFEPINADETKTDFETHLPEGFNPVRMTFNENEPTQEKALQKRIERCRDKLKSNSNKLPGFLARMKSVPIQDMKTSGQSNRKCLTDKYGQIIRQEVKPTFDQHGRLIRKPKNPNAPERWINPETGDYEYKDKELQAKSSERAKARKENENADYLAYKKRSLENVLNDPELEELGISSKDLGKTGNPAKKERSDKEIEIANTQKQCAFSLMKEHLSRNS